MALSGRDGHGDECLLVGVKQTQCGHAATSESDPKRTFVTLKKPDDALLSTAIE